MRDKIKIPLIKQGKKSGDCVRCCGLMVFRHLKNPISNKDLYYAWIMGGGCMIVIY